MPKKILIPLDGSKLGESALHYVEDLIFTLSAEQNIEVTLIQVIAPFTRYIHSSNGASVPMVLKEEEMEPVKKEALDYLNQAGERLRNRGVTVKCKIIVGDMSASSAEEIIRAEEYFNSDLVAMSTHGRRGVSKWVLGSVTEKVLHAGKVPILVVRSK
jgi:nucleotide-binding universal stress UspA family protein